MWLKFAPYVVCVLIGAGSAFGIIKYTQPEIKLECKPAACNCPKIEIPPSNGIDFDKIKNVKGLTIQNHQHFVMGGDTLSKEALIDAFRKVASEQKLSRCK